MENVRHGVAAVTTRSALQHRDDPTEAAVDHRLISFPWGTDRTVLIDVSIGALQEERELLQRIRALITATEQDRVFRLGDLAPEQRDDLWSLVSRFSPRGRFRSDDDPSDLYLMVEVDQTVQVTSGGKQITLYLGPKDPTEYRDAVGRLHQHPAPVRDSESAALATSAALSAPVSRMVVRTLGSGGRVWDEALTEVARHLAQLRDAIRAEFAAAADELATQVGEDPLSGSYPWDALTPDQKARIETALLDSAARHGFADADEARRYRASASTVSFSTQFGLLWSEQPRGGPGRPGIVGGVVFMRSRKT